MPQCPTKAAQVARALAPAAEAAEAAQGAQAVCHETSLTVPFGTVECPNVPNELSRHWPALNI